MVGLVVNVVVVVGVVVVVVVVGRTFFKYFNYLKLKEYHLILNTLYLKKEISFYKIFRLPEDPVFGALYKS